jgi:hypothetical protein
VQAEQVKKAIAAIGLEIDPNEVERVEFYGFGLSGGRAPEECFSWGVELRSGPMIFRRLTEAEVSAVFSTARIDTRHGLPRVVVDLPWGRDDESYYPAAWWPPHVAEMMREADRARHARRAAEDAEREAMEAPGREARLARSAQAQAGPWSAWCKASPAPPIPDPSDPEPPDGWVYGLSPALIRGRERKTQIENWILRGTGSPPPWER